MKTGAGPATVCPSCASSDLRSFYCATDVPVHSVMLHATAKEAVEYPKHDIELGFCRSCGHVANLRFDSSRVVYSGNYEETQGYSKTFREFHQDLSTHLVRRYGVREKRVLEIGCGKGEFLQLLCAEGNNRGIGFDPAYVPGRAPGPANDRIVFVRDLFGPGCGDVNPDLVVCKMTLEHIYHAREFVSMVRASIGQNGNTVVFFQVPDAERILNEGFFWDVYYEHCAYYTAASLGSLFERCGFEVMDLWKAYDDQYLMMEAVPRDTGNPAKLPGTEAIGVLEQRVERYRDRAAAQIAYWKAKLQALQAAGKRVAVWGAGSKAVAFLTVLDPERRIDCAVDINPHKRGKFIAGTGHEIVSPADLVSRAPAVVILMNPVYRPEVYESLLSAGMSPDLEQLDTLPERAA